MRNNQFPAEWLEEIVIHVLVISPDESLSQRISNVFSNEEYAIDTAANAFDGGMKMQESVPKVIIVDGLSHAVTLRNRLRSDERFHGVTLIAITGQDQIKEADGIEVFKKPFNPELLAQRIRTLTKEG